MQTFLPSAIHCGCTPIRNFLKNFFSAFALFLFAISSHAADYYWVGGTGNWSDFATHWATTSGGAVFHTSAPSQSDPVFFDANSFSAGGQVVTVNVTANCNNMNWTGVTNNPDLAGSSSLNIYGSLTYDAAMTATYGSAIYFRANISGNTITTNGVTINNGGWYFEGTGGWTFSGDLNAPAMTFYLNNGDVYTNGQTITIFNFMSMFIPNPRTFDLGASTINTNGWLIFMPAGLTIVPGTSTINISGGNFQGGGKTYNNLNITSGFGFVNISGGNTFDSLAVTGLINTVSFGNGVTNTVNFFSLPSGNCNALVIVNASGGTLTTISMASGTFNGD